MRRRVLVSACVLLVAVITFGTISAAAQPAVSETRLEAQLQDDGDARWTIVATVPLENESDVRNFQSFANAYEAGERDFRLGVEVFERAADEAAAESGREMTIHSTQRNARVVNESVDGERVQYGELRVSFTWGSFARIDEDGTMYVDDAFNTSSGTWLQGIGPGQVLIIKAPPGYSGPSTSPIGARDGDLEWEGPQSFDPGYLEMEYPPGAGIGDPPIPLFLLMAAIVLSAGALILGGYLLWRRREDEEDGVIGGFGGSGPDVAEPTDSGADAAVADGEVSQEMTESSEERNLEMLSDE